jgi:hypothetical protein
LAFRAQGALLQGGEGYGGEASMAPLGRAQVRSYKKAR